MDEPAPLESSERPSFLVPEESSAKGDTKTNGNADTYDNTDADVVGMPLIGKRTPPYINT